MVGTLLSFGAGLFSGAPSGAHNLPKLPAHASDPHCIPRDIHVGPNNAPSIGPIMHLRACLVVVPLPTTLQMLALLLMQPQAAPSTSAHLLPSPATFQHVLMSLQAVGCHVRGVETVVFAAHIDQCMPTEFQWYHASPLSAHLFQEKNATPEQSQYEPVFGCFRECKVKSFQLVGNRHPFVQQEKTAYQRRVQNLPGS